MKVDLHQVWPRFCKYSMLHGLKLATDAESTEVRRYVWRFCLMAAATWVVYSVTTAILNAIYPIVSTKLSTEDVPSLEFPGFTVCNNNLYSKMYMAVNTDALAIVLRSSPDYIVRSLEKVLPGDVMMKAHNVTFTEADNHSINLTKIMMEASPAHVVSDMVNAVYIKNEDDFYQGDNLSDIFSPELTMYGLCWNFTRKFNVTKSDHSSGVWMALNIHADDFLVGSMGSRASPGALLMIREMFSSPETSENTINMAPGMETMLPIRLVKRVKLASGRCFEFDSGHFDHVVSTSGAYTWTGCIEDCKANATIKICNCRNFYIPGDVRICQTPRDLICQHSNMLGNAFWDCHYQKCRPSCIQQEYMVRAYHSGYPANLMRDHHGQQIRPQDGVSVMVFFESLQITVDEEITMSSLNDLIGSIGGLLGLAFGASLFTLAEFVELLIIYLTSCSALRLQTKHKLSRAALHQ